MIRLKRGCRYGSLISVKARCLGWGAHGRVLDQEAASSTAVAVRLSPTWVEASLQHALRLTSVQPWPPVAATCAGRSA